ncbi:MAG: right-handed parallel beta-helix repeat-containing protein [Verrucomicrobiales bacterium]|nr:right-handed parallel beta-helix repeat-containing protein [Verrucomicrobiales bacterium]
MLYPEMKIDRALRHKLKAPLTPKQGRLRTPEVLRRLAFLAVTLGFLGAWHSPITVAAEPSLPAFDSPHAIHVRQDGDDATAERGLVDRAWRDLAKAFLVATNQDVIYVHGGEWSYPAPANTAEDDAHAEAPLRFWDKTDVTVRFLAPSRVVGVTEEGAAGTLVSWRNTTNCTWSGDFELVQPGFRNRDTVTNLNAMVWLSGRNLNPKLEGDSYARVVGGHHALLLVSVATYENYATEAENTEGLTVRKVWFQDIGSTNLVALNLMDGQCIPPLTRTLVESCVFTNCIRGVEIHSFFRQVKDVRVQNCDFIDTVEWAVGNVNSSNVTDVKILDNRFIQLAPPYQAAYQHAISISGTNQEVRGNLIRGHFEVGMQVLNVSGAWIQDNVFEGQNGMRAAVRLYSPAERLTFINNQFNDLTLWGLLSDYEAVQANLMILGNTFQNASTSGYPALELRSKLIDTATIQGNEFFDDRRPSLSQAIHINQATNLILGGNQYCGPDSRSNAITGDSIILLPDFSHAPPTIEMTILPGTSNLVIPTELQLSAEVTSIYGIQAVEFFVDGKRIETLTSEPWHYSWTGVAAGVHTLVCKATDLCGQVGESEPQIITVEGAKIASKATFLSRDTATRGLWKGRYGSDGYEIAAHVSELPTYTQPLTNSGRTFIFGEFVDLPSALERVERSDRISSFWLAEPLQTIDVSVIDGWPHILTLYCWDPNENLREQKVELISLDTGEILDSQEIRAFSDGIYLSWIVEGGVRVQLTSLLPGNNGVSSGVFFDSLLTFKSWQEATLASVGADGAPEADPDADGLSNLLEFALGLSPLKADPFPWSGLALGPSGLELTYSCLLACEGQLTVEGSSDLRNWSDDGVEIVESRANGLIKTVKVRLSQTSSNELQGYLRLRASLP